MTDETQESKVYKDFMDFYTLNDEQRKRQLTDEELKWICLHRKCRVDMTLFNPMQQCINNFKRKGRSRSWSQNLLIKMVKKTIKRQTEVFGEMYPKEMIEEYNRERRDQDKNFAIRSLEYHIESSHADDDTGIASGSSGTME